MINNEDLELVTKIFDTVIETLKTPELGYVKPELIDEVDTGFGLITSVLSNGDSIYDAVNILNRGTDEDKLYKAELDYYNANSI